MRWHRHSVRNVGGILSIIGLLIFGLVFGITQILKSRKGSVAISVTERTIKDGGPIVGYLTIKPRKKLQGQRVTLRLVCEEQWEEVRYDSEGYQEKRSESRERHSEQATISDALELKAGQVETVHFKINFPATLPRREVTGSQRTRSSYRNNRDRGWSRRPGHLEWRLVANLELDGLDLGATYSFPR